MDSRSSKKQQELLQFIDGFIKGNGYGPSYREIMRALGYKSVSTVAVHVNGLLAKGYIRKKDNSARSIEVVTLRNDAPKQMVAVLTAPGMKWLEDEIEKRLKTESDKEETTVLVSAAEILGSQRAIDFKEILSNMQGDEL